LSSSTHSLIKHHYFIGTVCLQINAFILYIVLMLKYPMLRSKLLVRWRAANWDCWMVAIRFAV